MDKVTPSDSTTFQKYFQILKSHLELASMKIVTYDNTRKKDDIDIKVNKNINSKIN